MPPSSQTGHVSGLCRRGRDPKMIPISMRRFRHKSREEYRKVPGRRALLCPQTFPLPCQSSWAGRARTQSTLFSRLVHPMFRLSASVNVSYRKGHLMEGAVASLVPFFLDTVHAAAAPSVRRLSPASSLHTAPHAPWAFS